MKISEILAFLNTQGKNVTFTGNPDGIIYTMSNLDELKDHSIYWIRTILLQGGRSTGIGPV